MQTNEVIFILYVKDQEKSKCFYEQVLGMSPTLHVPGMTEFKLSPGTSLGIMPGDGIVKILDNKIANPNSIEKIPRCEVYLYVEDPEACLLRLVKAGGIAIDHAKPRNWGDFVSYGVDLDGNILAFGKRIKEE